jgi:dTDP-glucose 4,6-dehydratase
VRHLLVTGGAGFIGANFVHSWVVNHPEDLILVLDALTYAGNRRNLAPVVNNRRVVFVRGDIGTPDLAADLLRTHAITTLVHFAAESHVDRSIAGPDPFLHTNVIGTHELLKAARQVWLEEGRAGAGACFHHISTDEVFGSLLPEQPPCTESSPYAPSSPYAASKAAADHLVRAYHHTYGLPVTTSNSSNNYGPYQFPEKLIPFMLVHLLEGRPLPVYGDGQQLRDWLFVGDHCRALDLIIQEGRPGQTYNIGGRNQWKNLDVVSLLCDLVDEAFATNSGLRERFPSSPAAKGGSSRERITAVADRPGHDRRYALDASKIERELGFCPQVSFEAGIKRTVDWYLANSEWWQSILDGSYRKGNQ